MIHHVFNSSVVSGPETLVLPNLQGFEEPCEVVLLEETRKAAGAAGVTEYARELGFRVHPFPVVRRLDLGAIRALRVFWKHEHPLIVHAHGPKASLYAMMALRGRRGEPRLITTHHGVRANDQTPKLRFYETVYEKLVIPRTDLCLTVCTSDRDLLIARGVPSNRIAVHLNGVGRRRYSGSARQQTALDVRKSWSAIVADDLAETFIVGVVGRLAPEKQHGLILEAFARLRKERPGTNVRLLCFGSGPLERELRDRTAALGLESCVHWLGYRSDMETELTGLDVLLSVSSAEGLPINLIEAGWAGVPVIATGIDGVRDLIEDSDSGVLLPSPAGTHDIVGALTGLLDDRARAQRLAERLQVRVTEGFSKEAWTHRLNEIYQSLTRGD